MQVRRHPDRTARASDADSAPTFEMPSPEQVAVAVRTFDMLSDPTRLKILWSLSHGEQPVNSLALLARAQPTAVSQHLAKLRLAGLVRQRREGNRIYYSANNAHVVPLIREALYHADHVAQQLPDHPYSDVQ